MGNYRGFIIGILVISLSLLPHGIGEPLQDYQADLKEFNYMDVCNLYPILNFTNDRDMSNVNDSQTLTAYEEVIGGTNLKPHKNILFNNAYVQDSLLLMTRYVYNWTFNDEFTINLYYEDFNNNSVDLPLFYNEYISDSLDNNVTYNYSYILGGWKEVSGVKPIYQKFSKLHNANDAVNIYNQYEKPHGAGNSHKWLKVQNVTIWQTITIDTNEWVEIRLEPDSFYYNNSLYNARDFINLGIKRLHQNHTLIINNIKISNRYIKNYVTDRPFLEYYEFKRVSQNSTNRVLFQLDMVENNYQNLNCYTMQLRINSAELEFWYNGVKYWDAGQDLYIDNGSQAFSYFTGYQINVQRDQDQHYHIYIYYKYHFNTREAGSNIVQYNYSFQKITIEAKEYAYLANVEYYDDTNDTDVQISFTANSHKWDIIDSELTKIDNDILQEVILIHDIDSGGMKIPSISDLKKAFTEKIVKPLTTTLTNFQSAVLIPMNKLTGSMDSLVLSIGSISSFVSTISTTVTGIDTVIDNIFTTVGNIDATLGSGITSITTTFTNEINTLENIVGTKLDNVKASVDDLIAEVTTISGYVADIESYVIEIKDGVNNMVNDINAVKDKINSIFTSLDVGGTIWTILDTVMDTIILIKDFMYIAYDFYDYFYTQFLLNDLKDMVDLVVDVINAYMSIAVLYFDISWTILGTVFLYRIILSLYNYVETDDINHIYEIANILLEVAELVFNAARAIVRFIASAIPL